MNSFSFVIVFIYWLLVAFLEGHLILMLGGPVTILENNKLLLTAEIAGMGVLLGAGITVMGNLLKK